MEDDYDDYGREYEYEDGVEDGMIRFYIFNSFGLIGGSAALVWAAWTLHRYRRSGGKDSIFVITLLFIDALELVMAVCTMFTRSLLFIPFRFIGTACFVLRLVSLFLHQLVALEGVASATHIRFAAVFSSVPCSVSLTLMTFMLVILICCSGLLFDISQWVAFLAATTVVPLLIHAVMCILICSKAKHRQAPGGGITDKTVLVESLVSYIVLHGPCLLVRAMYFVIIGRLDIGRYWQEIFQYYSNMFFTISSLWVIADGLLVVLVCRLPRVQHA